MTRSFGVLNPPQLADADDVTVVDVRERRAYEEVGHVPSAVNVPYERFRDPSSVSTGKLPTREDFATLAGAAGIEPTDTIVAYDDDRGVYAARFLLTAAVFGHEGELLVLDGGFDAWRTDHPVETDGPDVAETDYPADPPDEELAFDREAVEAAVDSLDVTEGTLYADDADGQTLLAEPVDTFDPAGLRGCDECADFLGGAADISVGNVASPDGWTTTVVRSERGERAFERASDALDVDDLEDVSALENLADWNSRRANAHLPREYDPAGSVGISHAEHREAYDDTDRAPEPLNPARVHQYEEWC